MLRRSLALVVLALCSLPTCLTPAVAAPDTPPEKDAPPTAAGSELVVGKPYPALRLPTIDRARWVDLASLRGKRVLLLEFASW